jgi:hypothetical protein
VPEGSGKRSDGGVGDALRAAIDRTLSAAGAGARAGSSALSPERAMRLLDEVARRGRKARDDITRRSKPKPKAKD